ncbi:unnamed protein product [Darwinula stevensoni]|uniref:R3H domain-containing protein n=1 Tax=Darwinula stevensoni TaxID=69355 RepID=A0A7R9FQ59_9CRUS|nr:unnamed protein product [Darwinula stevensoni]CAG0898875.1 unnamed protein product [Darwinula stevensoni]
MSASSFQNHRVRLLVRSHAMREATSPPPDASLTLDSGNGSWSSSTICNVSTSSNISLGTSGGGQGKAGMRRLQLRNQGSSGNSADGSSSSLSRDSSTEQYTDNTGIDLEQFIVDTLHRNQKDRVCLLKIEQELISLVKDSRRTHLKFPSMSSYQRMLVHRVAAYFGLDHNVDQSGTCVIVNKARNTRLPDMQFQDQIHDDFIPEEPRRSILKRDSSSFEDYCFRSLERQGSMDSKRSKSFEEREEEYKKAKHRIFNQDSSSSAELLDSPMHSGDITLESSQKSSQEDLRWCWGSSTESADAFHLLIHRKDRDRSSRSNALGKVQSFESGEVSALRPVISKSNSFGGYPHPGQGNGKGNLLRGDSITSTHSAGPRLLTKQDSMYGGIVGGGGGGGVSPASSGYKSMGLSVEEGPSPINPSSPHQNTFSISISHNPSSQGASPQEGGVGRRGVEDQEKGDEGKAEDCNGGNGLLGPAPSIVLPSNQPVLWAVTSIDSVPPGSILINPQTGQPLINPDGSFYRFDPGNPPQYASSSSAGISNLGIFGTAEGESRSSVYGIPFGQQPQQPQGALVHMNLNAHGMGIPIPYQPPPPTQIIIPTSQQLPSFMIAPNGMQVAGSGGNSSQQQVPVLYSHYVTTPTSFQVPGNGGGGELVSQFNALSLMGKGGDGGGGNEAQAHIKFQIPLPTTPAFNPQSPGSVYMMGGGKQQQQQILSRVGSSGGCGGGGGLYAFPSHSTEPQANFRMAAAVQYVGNPYQMMHYPTNSESYSGAVLPQASSNRAMASTHATLSACTIPSISPGLSSNVITNGMGSTSYAPFPGGAGGYALGGGNFSGQSGSSLTTPPQTPNGFQSQPQVAGYSLEQGSGSHLLSTSSSAPTVEGGGRHGGISIPIPVHVPLDLPLASLSPTPSLFPLSWINGGGLKHLGGSNGGSSHPCFFRHHTIPTPRWPPTGRGAGNPKSQSGNRRSFSHHQRFSRPSSTKSPSANPSSSTSTSSSTVSTSTTTPSATLEETGHASSEVVAVPCVNEGTRVLVVEGIHNGLTHSQVDKVLKPELNQGDGCAKVEYMPVDQMDGMEKMEKW